MQKLHFLECRKCLQQQKQQQQRNSHIVCIDIPTCVSVRTKSTTQNPKGPTYAATAAAVTAAGASVAAL